jgi:hypothetical protein
VDSEAKKAWAYPMLEGGHCHLGAIHGHHTARTTTRGMSKETKWNHSPMVK